MEFIMTNWWLSIIVLAIIIAACYAIYVFFKMPSNSQLKSVSEWLLYAVAQAEKELGSGTGQLKLRYVYDMFIVRFNALAKVVSFEAFSLLVDETLNIFKEMLRDNSSVGKYVGVEEIEEEILGIDVDAEGDDSNG